MRNYKRSVRVAELIKMKISEIIRRKVNDPRLSSVTITNVDLSDDLRHAKIFYSVLGSDIGTNESESMESLQNASKYIKSIIGQELGLRYVPDLRFEYDKFFQRSVEIVDLIENIEKNQEED